MGEVIQLQGDHRLKIKEFLVDSEAGLGLDEKNIKVCRVDSGPVAAVLYNMDRMLTVIRSTASKLGLAVAPQLSGLES